MTNEQTKTDETLAKMEKSHAIVTAKIAAMTDAEKARDNRITDAWLTEANREFREVGLNGRASRMMDRASDSGKTITELTNGVLPDGSQI